MEITLAYSPCPNDTFLFYHLVHSNLTKKFQIKEELHDVEHLNQKAKENLYQVTKLSFFAFFQVLNHYTLLDSGSALGRGCGPLLVKKKGKSTSKLENSNILVPGIWTTANLLTNIYLKKQFTPVPIRYDLISQKLLSEEYDFGVIIHEERFTYKDRGLEKVQDLGEFWESMTDLPIPLGAIAIQRKLDIELQKEFDMKLKESLDLAYQDPIIPKEYILTHSQEKNLKVVQSHIDLYVNDFTKGIGEEGKKAVIRLYEEAKNLNLLGGTYSDSIPSHLFYTLK
jgi:1,4-dihydroxy-6-naphthoate synthase